MLTTVCASCNTEFRVTWEQLKVRAGRVRCGQCHTVFNGLTSLNRHGEDDARKPDEIAPAGQIAPVSDVAPEAPPAQSDPDFSPGWPPLNLGEDSQPHLASQLLVADSHPLPAIEQSPVLAPPPASASEPEALESEPATNSLSTPPAFEFGPRPGVKSGRWWLPLATLLLLVLLSQ